MLKVIDYCQAYVQETPLGPKKVAVVDSWLRCSEVLFCYKHGKWDPKTVVVVGRWSLAQV
jgi:hypothetical protein